MLCKIERRKIMTFGQIICVSIIVYLCVYALISRICKTVEHCATIKAYEEYLVSGGKPLEETEWDEQR